ncbi:MAG: hypothetical protein CSA96_10205 [Bacteroidetes bacterium]|nr:MAG: hypothetical protein CSA96_10205 [Bacteroidota bacterium]
MKLEKYSFGIGDRFAREGKAQLESILRAGEHGIPIVPVWNKSNREHQIIHTEPLSTRHEADEAVRSLNWEKSYYVDADHINLSTVDAFIPHADFFTIDVADYIGKAAEPEEIERFLDRARVHLGSLEIPGIPRPFKVDEQTLQEIAKSFLAAIKEAAAIYRHIEAAKGAGRFIAEISMDEVETPQSPVELFFILQMIGHYEIPVQTIAPKFTGRFNKGVDYVGDLGQFEKEFEEDLLLIAHAIKEFGLPENLKLSVHSGSDKFSIYPIIGALIRKHDAGIHVKTAGTTWLEEVIGLALAGGDALEMAKKIYSQACKRREELCEAYATVIDIDPSQLPSPEEVAGWDGERFARSLRHIPDEPDYNPGFRQLIHVAYKLAAEMGNDFLNMLDKHAGVIREQVSTNIYERHLKRLFPLDEY